jgi:voltage-gated potassium channel Kch
MKAAPSEYTVATAYKRFQRTLAKSVQSVGWTRDHPRAFAKVVLRFGMRILRLFKKESHQLLRAFLHPTFIYLTVVGNVILFLATTAVYFLERNVNPPMSSYFNCLWWGASTITTVAYGDILPITLPGRLIAIGLMYTGTVLFITFTGVLLTFLMREEVERELTPLEKEIRVEEKETERIERLIREIHQRLDRMEQKR